MVICIIIMVTHEKVSDLVFFPGLLRDMTVVLWKKLCDLHKQNRLALSQAMLLLSASELAQWTLQEQEDALHFLPHYPFFLGKAFSQNPKKLDIPSLASLLKIHLSHADVQIILIWHHLNSVDEQECLFFPPFHSIVLFSQLTSLTLICFA